MGKMDYWLGRQAEWTAVAMVTALTLLAGVAGAQTLVEKGSETGGDPSKRELGELVTDRPDFTESTEVTGAGVFQFENGVTLEKDRSAGLHRIAGPELLMRVGINKRLELRVGGEGYGVNRFTSGGSSRGHTDGEIGFKYKVLDEKGKRPAFSVLPILNLPVGRSEFSSGGYDPSVKLLWAKDLTAGFTLAGNVNFGSYKDGDQRLFQSVSSWSVGRGLVGNLSAYWEVFVLAPYELDSGNAWIFNGGITHPWGKHAQLDLRVGKRITAMGPNWFVGTGVSFRQPTKLFLR